MKNLKLYEDFKPSEVEEFPELLSKLVEFFPESNDADFRNPEKYILYGRVYVFRRAKTPDGKKKTFANIVEFLNENDYDFISFPPAKGFDFERLVRVMGSLDYSYVLGEGLELAIAIPTKYLNENLTLIITIGEKNSYFRLYRPDRLEVAGYESDDPHKYLKALL
jgi:hypothetical protein